MSIPFEVLDIHINRKIHLDLNHIYNKVVNNKRGGFCYELNFLFYSLLKEIGFDCKMVSARIFDNETYGPKFDHMSIIVQMEDEWLVDVGFGDLFIEPLKIDIGVIQYDVFRDYKILKTNKAYSLVEVPRLKGINRKKYLFDVEQTSIDQFNEQCDFKQYSPDSHFVKNLICTLPTKNGRKTILNSKFKTKEYGILTEEPIESNEQLVNILKDHFGIILDSHD